MIPMPVHGVVADQQVIDFNFLRDDLDTRITFTRASAGTMTNASGVLVSVGVDTPRIDYRYDTGTSSWVRAGLLSEYQSTNLIHNSANLGAGTFTQSNCAVTTSGTAPDGTGQWNVITEDLNSGVPHLVYDNGITIGSGDRIAQSIYIKAGTRRYVSFEVAAVGSCFGVMVDTQTWTISSYTIGTGATVLGSELIPAGNGVYRLCVSGTLAASVTSIFPAVGGAESMSPAAGVNTTYTGTNATIVVWGFQVENTPYAAASSYIPTSGGTASRSTESVTIPLSFGGYSTLGGTVMADVTTFAKRAYPSLFQFGAIPERWFLFYDPEWSNIGYRVDVTGGDELKLAGSATPSRTTPVRVAIRFAATDFAMCINGGTTQTATTGVLPAATGNFVIGAGDAPLMGHVRRIRYNPRLLSDNDLKQITA